MVDVIVAYGVDIDIEEHPPSIIDPAHYLLLRVELGYARHRAEDFILLKIKVEMWMVSRVSQKNQKSEFWNATYPSGFHRLDEPPEKNSAL